MTALLIVLAVGFAWSIGAHYTGAVMGMPHALRAIGETAGSPLRKLVLMLLADYADSDGRFWGDWTFLSEVTECSQQDLDDAMDALAADGLLVAEDRSTIKLRMA